MKQIPLWLIEFLRSCPKANHGVHTWLMSASLKLLRNGVDEDEAVRLINKATAHCGRIVPDDEISRTVMNAKRKIANSDGAAQVKSLWPAPDEDCIRSVASAGPKLVEFASQSPVKWDEGEKRCTEEVIDALFPGNPLLCAAPTQQCSITQPREQWRGRFGQLQFIVPNPMTARFGETQSGTLSMRSLKNTGPRRFVVVEFDRGTVDLQAALIAHLATLAPLALAVHSGGKSIHAWYHCATDPDPTVEKFFRYAVSLGADRATWTRCQLVRMPDGQREDGRRQRVIYFNPNGVTA